MKKFLALVLALVLLLSFSGCSFVIDGVKKLVNKPEETTGATESMEEAIEESSQPTTELPTEPEPEPTEPATTAPAPTEPPKLNKVPYTLNISRLNLPIFSGPGYDNSVVEVVYKQGIYTITKEEIVDGTRWGKLKSGLGWVDLDQAVRSVPAAVSYTHSSLTSRYPVVSRVKLDNAMDVYVFVDKTARNFEVVQIDGCHSAPYVSKVHARLGNVNAGEAVMISMAIYGDAQESNVGIRFTDSTGSERIYYITDNGRNNMLSLVEV